MRWRQLLRRPTGSRVARCGRWWNELPEQAKQEAFTTFARRALVRRNGHPEDVAQAIAALVENGFITGVVLPCDGGLRLS